jgi:cyanamide hydratase
MSFEFYGAILALQKLKELNGPISQAESVSEAIIRHQDPVEIGTISTIGLLIQLATQYGRFDLSPSLPCGVNYVFSTLEIWPR